jgi:hypothetical protein
MLGIEIIERREGSKAQKQIIGPTCAKPQISYNSDGRIVVRLIENSECDTLIIVDSRVSELLIDFCQNSLKNNYVREDTRVPVNDLPF